MKAAIAEPEKLYKVQMEVSSKNLQTGLTQYAYTDHQVPQSKGPVNDIRAQEIMEEMKAIGVGGRIILLDGSPEGIEQVKWGGVERTAEAEKVEKEALEKAGGGNGQVS